MTHRLAILAGAALLSAASLTLAHAGPASDAWISQAKTELDSRLQQAGLNDDGRQVQLRLTIGPGRDGYAVRIVRSSGSQDFDSAAKAAAREARFQRPPAELVGRTVTFTLGDDAAASGAQ